MFFQDMEDLDIFDKTDVVHIDVARLCFMKLIRSELKQIAQDWNHYYQY